MKRNIYFYFTAILSLTYILLLLAKPLLKDDLAALTNIVPKYGNYFTYHIQLLVFLIPMLLISIIEYFRLKLLPLINKKLANFLLMGTFFPLIFLFLSFLISAPDVPRRYYEFDMEERETVFSLFDFLTKPININAMITMSAIFFVGTQIIRIGELIKSYLANGK